ncbi:MAG: phosphoribosylglycinamide formyltransferase [Candidatus Amulumruptor caecigallinarius]|nr:phosphoribosylglycinamide formyltransferase [Candidatus Amulumruptor caecigallinarius]MCM1396204.1 phosphoribosylglycinamide formyltransferase [Candidatus Amulumruptor caecigallinarius]MCM1453796.1 phosphoribosylglycinamide formyltransferase [bacterium]
MHRIAVIASGTGTNAENLARAFADSPQARVVLMLSNKADAGAHSRLNALGIPSVTFTNQEWAECPDKILALLHAESIDFIALCGFLRKVHPAIVAAYKGRIVNIHPSLLPRHGGKGMYGMKVHQAVIDAGDEQTGATVHYVTDEMDEGDIIIQGCVPVIPGDDAATVAAKVHAVEMDIYPQAVAKALSETTFQP